MISQCVQTVGTSSVIIRSHQNFLTEKRPIELKKCRYASQKAKKNSALHHSSKQLENSNNAYRCSEDGKISSILANHVTNEGEGGGGVFVAWSIRLLTMTLKWLSLAPQNLVTISF